MPAVAKLNYTACLVFLWEKGQTSKHLMVVISVDHGHQQYYLSYKYVAGLYIM